MTVIVARIFCPRFSSTDESNERDVESHPRLYETKGKIFLFLRIEYDLFERKVFGMRAAYYFSSSHLRKAARSSFAESDFRCVSKRNTAFRNACSGDRPSRDPTWTVCFRCYYFHRSSILGSFRFLSETIAQCTVHRSIVSLSNNMLVAETRDATRVTQQCTS